MPASQPSARRPKSAAPAASQSQDVITLEADVGVVGAGLAGLTAALALARRGFDVTLVAPIARADRRTTALLADSVDFLRSLGVWDAMEGHAAPIATMRLIDATGRLIRAPQTEFRSAEIGLPAFGYNVRNAVLTDALRAACDATGNVRFVEAAVNDAAFRADGATLTLSDGNNLDCRLVVAADGRNSLLRKVSGIGERQWNYPQVATVLDFQHSIDHHDTSTEFHTPHGPFTVVPLARGLSSLVWVTTAERAAQIGGTDDEKLALEMEAQMQSMLGKVKIVSDRQSFPLGGLTARSFGKGPLVLVGEAAHLFPPIGAQGFNLGIRDVEQVDRLAASAGKTGLSGLGERYHRARGVDVNMRTASVDIMNRTLLSSFLPAQMARSVVMHALGNISPLRRMAMREGVAPGSQFRHLIDSLRKPVLPAARRDRQPKSAER